MNALTDRDFQLTVYFSDGNRVKRVLNNLDLGKWLSQIPKMAKTEAELYEKFYLGEHRTPPIRVTKICVVSTRPNMTAEFRFYEDGE